MIFPDQKKGRYTPCPLSAPICVASGNYASDFTNPSESPQVILMGYDDSIPNHTIMKDKPGSTIYKRGYCSRHHKGIICYRKLK